MTPFTFTRQNRAPRTVLILIGVFAGLISLVIFFNAALWLVGVLALATLPVIWDIVKDTSAGLTLDRDCLRWHSGGREGEIDLNEIDFFRFDTRWDFSVRVSLMLRSGKRIRLPDESVPPHRAFENTLENAGFRVERHHFTVF